MFKLFKRKRVYVTSAKFFIYWEDKNGNWKTEVTRSIKPTLYDNFVIPDFQKKMKEEILKSKGRDDHFSGSNLYLKNFKFKDIKHFFVKLDVNDIKTEKR